MLRFACASFTSQFGKTNTRLFLILENKWRYLHSRVWSEHTCGYPFTDGIY